MVLLKINTFLAFASEQEKLRKITCVSRREYSAEKDMNLLLSFPSRMPNLRDLRLLLLGSSFCWKDDWSNLVGASSLETLCIICNKIDFSKCSGLYPCNAKLISLGIGANKVEDLKSMVPLMQTFPNLRTLRLSYVNDDILEYVCSTQVQMNQLLFFLENSF